MSARVIVTGAAGGIGGAAYAIVGRLPRRLVDRAGERQLRRLARKGHFAGSRSPPSCTRAWCAERSLRASVYVNGAH